MTSFFVVPVLTIKLDLLIPLELPVLIAEKFARFAAFGDSSLIMDAISIASLKLFTIRRKDFRQPFTKIRLSTENISSSLAYDSFYYFIICTVYQYHTIHHLISFLSINCNNSWVTNSKKSQMSHKIKTRLCC